MAVTVPNQFELSSTPSLLMGALTVFRITMVAGLGMPDISTNDLSLLNGGTYAARDSVESRTVNLDVLLLDPATFMTSLTAFMTAWQPTNTDIKLTFRLDGQAANRYVWGRPRRAPLALTPESGPRGAVKIPVDFFCQDPTIYLSSGDTPTVL